MVILVRFCWKFATERDDKTEKKIKGREAKKKGKLLKKERAPAEEELKTNERFLSPPKKTNTNTTL